MPLITGRVQVVMKAEGTPGTVETLELAGGLAAGAEMILCDSVKYEPDAVVTERSALSAALGTRGSVVGSRTGKISFRCQLRGKTTAFAAANLPDVHLPFEACGCSVTMSGGAGAEIVTVAPVSAISSWFTVGVYNDGVLHRIAGALGDVTLTLKSGEPVSAEFVMTGAYSPTTDVALRTSGYAVALPAPPPFLAAALTVLGYATPRIETMTFGLGNAITMEVDPNSTTGNYRAAPTGRAPRGSLDPEIAVVATKNYFNEWVAGTLGALNTGTFPSTGVQYNKIALSQPNVKYKKATTGDRGGLGTVPIDYESCHNTDAGDDFFSLVYS